MKTRQQLKDQLSTGRVPAGEDFADVIDSLVHHGEQAATWQLAVAINGEPVPGWQRVGAFYWSAPTESPPGKLNLVAQSLGTLEVELRAGSQVIASWSGIDVLDSYDELLGSTPGPGILSLYVRGSGSYSIFSIYEG